MNWENLKRTVFSLGMCGIVFGTSMPVQAQTALLDYSYDDSYYYYDDDYYYSDDSYGGEYYYGDDDYYGSDDNYSNDDNYGSDDDSDGNYDYDSEIYDTPQEIDILEAQAVAKKATVSVSISVDTKYDSSTGSYVSPQIVWTVDDNSTAKISETSADGTEVKVKGVKEGSTQLHVTYTYQMTKGQIIYTSAATVDVTNPKLSAKTVGINLYSGYGEASISLSGLSENSTITCTPSSKK